MFVSPGSRANRKRLADANGLTVANDGTDTGCFLAFFNAATGANLGPKTNAALQFNASTGLLTLSGDVELVDAAAPSAPASGRAILGSFNQQGFSVPHWFDPQGNAIELTRDNIFIAKNVTGSTITKGSAVYISGHATGKPEVSLAKADSLSTMPAAGVAYEDITNNNYGRVLSAGHLENADMSSFLADDTVYVSSSSAGALTSARPTFAQAIGVVLSNSATVGILRVDRDSRPDVHYERVNAQTGTTYTFLISDFGRLVTFSNVSAIAVTLPQAGTTFQNGWNVDCTNKGAGTVTITPTTSTINGAATYTLTTGQSIRIVSDGTNYQVTGAGVTSPSSLGLSDGTTVEDVGGVLTAIPVTNSAFNFRLTLLSGTAVPTTDQTSKSTVYLTPYNGNRIDLYDGTRWQRFSSAEVSVAIGTVVPYQAYDVFAYNNAGTLTLEILEWANHAVTFSSGAGDLTVTWTTHGLAVGNSVTFTTTGSMATNVSANTQYFVSVVVDANTIKIASTRANAAAGTYVQNGVSAGSNCTGHQPQARQTALVLQDGVYVKSGATTRRYCGTFLADSTTTTQDSAGGTGAAPFRLLWNAYNRVLRPVRTYESTNTWTYTTVAYRQANASTINQVNLVCGWPVATLSLRLDEIGLQSAANGLGSVSIGEDSTTTPATEAVIGVFQIPGTQTTSLWLASSITKNPAIGLHAYIWLERGFGSGTNTWAGSDGVSASRLLGLSGFWEC